MCNNSEQLSFMWNSFQSVFFQFQELETILSLVLGSRHFKEQVQQSLSEIFYFWEMNNRRLRGSTSVICKNMIQSTTIALKYKKTIKKNKNSLYKLRQR